MGGRRAQISLEYTAVLASMLVMLIILLLIFNGIYAQNMLHTDYTRASHTLSLLDTYSKMQWAGGIGSHHYQLIDIPTSIKLQNSSISQNSMSLHISGFGDVFSTTDFNLSGWWPEQTGTTMMSLRNNGSHILIRPAAMISISKKGFYFTSSGSESLTIRNFANESFIVSRKLFFSDCGTCTYSDDGSDTIASGQYREGNIDIPSLPAGIYSGYLQINSTPLESNSLLENTSINIPITVVR